MARITKTTAVIDGLLNIAVGTGVLATTIIAPNALQALDRPLQRYFKSMDKRKREREWVRITRYMQAEKLVKNDYQHGLVLTEKGRKRAEKVALEYLEIDTSKKWDKKWRIVLYDIPEKDKYGRDALTRKLKHLGFYQLQRSVWVHPYPCRTEIEAITSNFGIESYVSYIETSFIDKQELLQKKFPAIH